MPVDANAVSAIADGNDLRILPGYQSKMTEQQIKDECIDFCASTFPTLPTEPQRSDVIMVFLSGMLVAAKNMEGKESTTFQNVAKQIKPYVLHPLDAPRPYAFDKSWDWA